MKVNYVKTIGFRKFQNEFETNIYDVTNITGKNRSGKSNILFAIVNIMLGTNLSGDEKVCLINKNCDASYGELHFTDNNGEKHILIRGKNKYSNKGNFITLDGKTIKQEELISFYKDKKLFLSVINPMYFLSRKTSEQKEMVDKYLSDIKPKEIFDRLNSETKQKLLQKYYNSKDKKFEELTAKEQEEFINFKMMHICKDIAYSNLDENERNILEGVPTDIPAYITELNSSIKKAEGNVFSLNGKIEYAQNIVDEELPTKKVFEKEEELSLARQEVAFLTSNKEIIKKENQAKVVRDIEKEIHSIDTELIELDKQMQAGKKTYLAIKNGESSICPMCSQHIPDESKKTTIKAMYTDLTAKYNKKNLLETKIKDMKVKLTVEKCKYHALEGNPDVENSKRIKVAQENVNILEKEKAEIEQFNHTITIKEKNIKSAKADISKFKSEKNAQNKLIDNLKQAKKVAQKLYILYIEEKMKLVKEYLKDVNIKFYSVLKTDGEIKEDFIITYNNTPLADLSRSETIATALEFANMFNKISRLNAPIFVDDYESCADYDFISDYSKDTQLIISKVEKGNLLKIADANNSSNCTIIKPTIKSAKTTNTYNSKDNNNTNNATDLMQAA